MRNKTLLLLITLMAAANASAEGIRYDRIPADATGYLHMDVDRLLSSRLAFADKDKDSIAQITAFVGEHADVTFYAPKSDEPGPWVLLWHTADPKRHKRLEAALEHAKAALSITYGQQAIHYTAMSFVELLQTDSAVPPPPATEPAKKDEKQEGKSPVAPNGAPVHDYDRRRGSFSIGMGLMDNPATGPNPYRGPTFAAFVGPDLIVVANDLPVIAGALDVIQGKKPSLAKQDPQGLKLELPAGAMLVGAGLTAMYSTQNPNSPDSHTTGGADKTADTSGGAFDFGMFGSFKAKACAARFDMGEDEKQVYLDVSLNMKDAESTEQLKNLVIGVKALIMLTQEQAKPVLEPLEIRSADKNVIVRWTWPIEKLPELVRIGQMQKGDGHSAPATAPARAH